MIVGFLDASTTTITWIIAAVAIVFLINGIDDLLIDVLFVLWRFYRRVFFSKEHRPISAELLASDEEKWIAIMVPAWHEQSVIGKMLDHAVATIDYSKYVFFVGVYSNDPETRQTVIEASERWPLRVVMVDIGHEGPTTKADCLNGVLAYIKRYEAANGMQFDIFVLDDAEDVVSKTGLRVFNHLIPRKDFVQLPVFPIEVPWYQFTAGHYMDEFAQLHLKDMRTREWLTNVIPSAGVGAAFSRRAIELATELNGGVPFSDDTLTEDYELPLQLAKLQVREAFVEANTPIVSERDVDLVLGPEDARYPYIRSFFPRTFRAAVRQKSRWVLGIALQGWEHLGWKGAGLHKYMLWRDRKALIGNLANFLGYILVVITLGIWFFRSYFTDDGRFPNVVPNAFIYWLLIVNFYIMCVQLIVRAICTYKIYGVMHGLLSIPRAVWGNFINFAATLRAMTQYFRARREKREKIPWDKTEYEYPH